MKYLPSIFFYLSILTATAQETVSQYRFHGFSEDLKYAILETYAEGNDRGTSKFIFVDVDKNEYAASTIHYDGKSEETIESVCKNALAKAQPNFRKFNFTGKRQGKPMGENFQLAGNTYKVLLKEVETGTYDAATGNLPIMKMDLSILINGNAKTLQKDNKLPAARSAATGYTIKAVYVEQNKIAVVVEYEFGPGFEASPDRYNMLVTGVL